MEIIPGVANFVLCHLMDDGPDAASIVHKCREYGLFLRDAENMSPGLGRHAIRIAVKDTATNHKMLDILKLVLSR